VSQAGAALARHRPGNQPSLLSLIVRRADFICCSQLAGLRRISNRYRCAPRQAAASTRQAGGCCAAVPVGA